MKRSKPTGPTDRLVTDLWSCHAPPSTAGDTHGPASRPAVPEVPFCDGSELFFPTFEPPTDASRSVESVPCWVPSSEGEWRIAGEPGRKVSADPARGSFEYG
ncbi:hypothetical protein JW916_08760 [Candidatus Sumerlaeota bacterium]|nr:hypothetical protein [Candidatus Sumerlaeota bacterium]